MIVILAGILWIINWIDYTLKSRAISFDNPGGEVKVSLSAIEEFITSRISTQSSGVKSVKVKTSLTPKGLETSINLKLVAGINIPETCANIQEITKNYLQDAVGIDRISNIEVFVTNIISGETFEKDLAISLFTFFPNDKLGENFNNGQEAIVPGKPGCSIA